MENMDKVFEPTVGTKVKVSDLYKNQYPNWGKDAETATIRFLDRVEVPSSSLGSKDIQMYQNRYGKKNSFPLWTLLIQFDGEDMSYIVSQFGVEVQE